MPIGFHKPGSQQMTSGRRRSGAAMASPAPSLLGQGEQIVRYDVSSEIHSAHSFSFGQHRMSLARQGSDCAMLLSSKR